MGHTQRGRFLQDGWIGTEAVHIFEHYTDDSKVVVMPIKRDAADRVVARSRVVWLPEQPVIGPLPWWEIDCVRVHGEIACPVCGRFYRQHPIVSREAPTLVVPCDGGYFDGYLLKI